jgi:hypothetical protein
LPSSDQKSTPGRPKTFLRGTVCTAAAGTPKGRLEQIFTQLAGDRTSHTDVLF